MLSAWLALVTGAGLLTTTACADSASTSPAVFVTDYLPGRFREGQNATRVDLSTLGWSHKSPMHAGFMTLDKQLGKSTFFWYAAPLDGNMAAPVLVWLQGGPGASSLFGMFTEVGPFMIGTDGDVQARAATWNQHFHMLFLDNPVGVGFSFTQSEAGFVTDEQQVGNDLHTALVQFYQLFPALRPNELYVTGESYGGKYVPACAYTVHVRNRAAPPSDRINLRGIAIGDGAMDPPAQFRGFGDLLFHLGMADEAERQQFRTYEASIQERLKSGDNLGAFEVFDEMLNGDFFPYPTYYANVTGMSSNYFNFQLAPDAESVGGDFVGWLNKPAVRAQIHVGDRAYVPLNSTVEVHLKHDWMRGVVDMLVPLMENYKVLIYNGQNDIILGPALTEQFLYGLEWSGQRAYAAARKAVWRRAERGPGSRLPDVAGYVREVKDFVQVVVRGAGHMVPGDQPERALDMIQRFVAGRSFKQSSSTIVV
mmetsp:Transcript_43911/g.125179  ORF Transcript_43911/g.125179 Transcript_43911/m.125179 type:complete len:480 (+) Transcript_43911:66-1505(+)